MAKPFRTSSFVWLLVPFAVCAFLLWMNVVRIRHIESVSALGGWSEKASAPVSVSPAPELAAGNKLVAPELLTESFHWLAQTQRMFNREEWRLRHIDYENAPFGRAVHSPSPYRWWLGSLAWCDHLMTGRSLAQSVERAALIADPLLHFLLILGATTLVVWRFGALPATLVSIGLVTFFPFAGGYLPGMPDDRGLAQIFALASVLLLAAGVRTRPGSDDGGKATQVWFILAGVSGGLGLWISVSIQIPILAGVAAGALLAACVARNHRPEDAGAAAVLPWRSWATAGAVTTLVAYLIEFAPAHLGDWQLISIHPLYGLAWLGGGVVLAQAAEWIQGKEFTRTFRNLAVIALALAAIAALPVAVWKIHGSAFLFLDTSALRLTKLPEGAIAPGLVAWIIRDGLTPAIGATLLPLVVAAPAVWLLMRAQTGCGRRIALAITLGPVLIALGFACNRLAWWNTLDGLLLIMLAVTAATLPRATNRGLALLAWGSGILVLSLGLLLVMPRYKAQAEDNLSRSEVLGLIERDLAGWLALHADPAGAVLLAPPNETTALCYYGGMRGMGSLSLENKEGVAAAVLVLKATRLQEAKELIERRGITHLVLLSWDSSFDDYAQSDSGRTEGSFRDLLKLSTLPLWLRPLAYRLPTIAGFEGQSVTLFEVVEEQDEATAVSRIAEYLVEMGDLEQAAAAEKGLRRFPADLVALVARAEVQLARGDEAEFARSLKVLQFRLAAKPAPVLPWDQRVALAVILAKAKQEQLAREQVTLCLAQADERKLRSLSPGSLYRLLVLSRAFGKNLDPKLRELALNLVPDDLRDRLR